MSHTSSKVCSESLFFHQEDICFLCITCRLDNVLKLREEIEDVTFRNKILILRNAEQVNMAAEMRKLFFSDYSLKWNRFISDTYFVLTIREPCQLYITFYFEEPFFNRS